MTFEETKYCQECKYCKRIQKDTHSGQASYRVDCKHLPNTWGESLQAVMYCKYKQLKNK